MKKEIIFYPLDVYTTTSPPSCKEIEKKRKEEEERLNSNKIAENVQNNSVCPVKNT